MPKVPNVFAVSHNYKRYHAAGVVEGGLVSPVLFRQYVKDMLHSPATFN
jgi:hypothetical protein